LQCLPASLFGMVVGPDPISFLFAIYKMSYTIFSTTNLRPSISLTMTVSPTAIF
jgi:hypothetical protein